MLCNPSLTDCSYLPILGNIASLPVSPTSDLPGGRRSRPCLSFLVLVLTLARFPPNRLGYLPAVHGYISLRKHTTGRQKWASEGAEITEPTSAKYKLSRASAVLHLFALYFLLLDILIAGSRSPDLSRKNCGMSFLFLCLTFSLS
jgi:hypothetical protein